MNLGLTDRVAIVTGASRGIGRACAADLLAEGAHVVVASKDPKRNFDLKELIAIVGRALAEPKERVATAPDDSEFDSIPLVGRSPAMQEIYRVLAQTTPEGLPHAFAEEFAKAYATALAELAEQDKRPPAASRRAP